MVALAESKQLGVHILTCAPADGLRLKTITSPLHLAEHHRFPGRDGRIPVTAQYPLRLLLVIREDQERDIARIGKRAAQRDRAKRVPARLLGQQSLQRLQP